MSKTAATEGALGELHNTIATVLTAAVKGTDVSASVLAVAVKFLKDNDITCVVGKDNKLGELEEAVAASAAPSDPITDPVLQDALNQVVSMDAYRNGTA